MGNDLLALQELRTQLLNNRNQETAKQNEILAQAKAMRTTEEGHRDWLETKLTELRSTLAALPRELYASALPMAGLLKQAENEPINTVYSLVNEGFNRVNELEQRKFNLSRNRDCEAMRNASGISRTFKKLFNKKARSVWAEWTGLKMTSCMPGSIWLTI